MTGQAALPKPDRAQVSTAAQGTAFAAKAWRYLRTELAPTPGRFDAMVRTLVASVITTIVSMALEVPLLSLSLFVIFMINQENYVRARMVAIGIVLTATVGAGLAILILRYTLDDTLLRILVCALTVFACAYFQRVCKLGILFSLISLVVVFGQAAADDVRNGEVIVRLCLWAWVSVAYPAMVALAINVWVLPARPGQQFADEACRQLDHVRQIISGVAVARSAHPVAVPAGGPQAAMKLLHLQEACKTQDKNSLWAGRTGLLLISALDLMTAAASRQAVQPAALSDDQTALLARIGVQLDAMASAIRDQSPPAQTEPWARVGVSQDSPEFLQDMVRALHVLFDTPDLREPAILLDEEPLFLADAWHNPSYMHIALKTMLSTYICYVIYTGISWPGIHTCMLTCIIVAVPGLGASTLKGALRVGGCVAGSLIALLATVFILPGLDTLTGLVLLVAPIVAVSAWITAGSERISYAGLQLMFAFALSVLDHFGPTTNLTEMRDRLVGVLLGVTVSALVNVYLWPDSNHEPLLRQARRLMDAIDAFALPSQVPLSADAIAAARLRIWIMLAKCEEGLSERLMEPGQQIKARQQLLALTSAWTTKACDVVQRMSRACWDQRPVDAASVAALADLNAQMNRIINWPASAPEST